MAALVAPLVAFYKNLSKPIVYILESLPGRCLQYFLRFFAEFRPVLALAASFVTMIYNAHDVEQNARQPILLENYLAGCMSNNTCNDKIMLDYGNQNGSWRTLASESASFQPSLIGIVAFIAFLGLGTLIPFFTFRVPKEFAECDIIDTALCFHINLCMCA